MRTIEELRSLVKQVYPYGVPISYAQPISYIDPNGPLFTFGPPPPGRSPKILTRKRHRDDHRRKKMMTQEEKDAKAWPLPQEIKDVEITQEEWVMYARKAWNEHFSGGSDGVLATAIGSFKWNFK